MDIRCGGVPMVDPTGSMPDDPSPVDGAMGLTQMGKRYVDADARLSYYALSRVRDHWV